MHLKLQPATADDAESVAALRNAVSDDLTFKHGRGPWTAHATTGGVLSDLREALLLVALHRGEAVASLKLSTQKPLSIDLGLFPKIARPYFLTEMVIAPDMQRQGIGRACLDQAMTIARRKKAGAILLDAFDHPTAGAGPFYTKCGFREAGRSTYRGTPRVYYEIRLGQAAAPIRKQSKKA